MMAPTLFKLISRECFCPSGGPPLKQRYWWCSLCPDTQATGWSLSFTSHRAIRNKWPPLLLPSSALLQPHWLLALSLWMCQAHSCLKGFAWLKLPGSTSPRKPPNLLQLLQCFEPPLGEVFQIILASGPTPHSSLFFIMIFTTSNTL